MPFVSEHIAARMRNYMLHIMRTKSYTPKYYRPLIEDRRIEAHHVAGFYGVHIADMVN